MVLTKSSFIPWLVQEADRVAQQTRNGGDAPAYLWAVAVEALDWLRHLPDEEREQALQTLKQCIDTRGVSAGVTIPTDRHAAECLVRLLRYVHHPPQVL
jgi:uncharacterized heparinase superfamily protein